MPAPITGFAFPFRIAPGGGVATSSDREKIRQNILVILGTRLGERAMLRNFGTRLPSLVHEPNDDVLANVIETQAREALVQWEPRILVQAVDVEPDPSDAQAAIATILYKLVATQGLERVSLNVTFAS